MTQNQAEQNKIREYKKDSKPYGLTYGEWTVKWWQWALITPLSVNPVADGTGLTWNTNQPSSDVWFLAGKFGNSDKILPKRKIKMPRGRSILFPVLNCEANPLEYPELKSEEELESYVVSDVNTVVKRDCFINGMKIIPQRVPSDPRVFPITIDKDNAFDIKGGGSTRAAADGFWIFLEPLPEGHHVIDFEGSCEFGRLNSGAKYELEIL